MLLLQKPDFKPFQNAQMYLKLQISRNPTWWGLFSSHTKDINSNDVSPNSIWRKKILELFNIDVIIMMVWHIIHIYIVHRGTLFWNLSSIRPSLFYYVNVECWTKLLIPVSLIFSSECSSFITQWREQLQAYICVVNVSLLTVTLLLL